jgi:transposase
MPLQLFTRRRETRNAQRYGGGAPVFVPAVIEPSSVTAVPVRSVRPRADGMVELEIDGVAVKIGHGADASVIAAVTNALKVSR